MRDQILEIIEKNPKLFTQIIRRNKLLLDWVQENSLTKSDTFAARVYSALHQVSDICKNNKTKKFVSISQGFSGCGKAANCECVRDATSESVKLAKSQVTPEKQEEINNKRRATNLEKYGVICTAQTPHAIQRMKDYYADPEKVAEQLARVKRTYQEKYGVENCRQIPEVNERILATLLARYGVTNISQIPTTKAKLRARMAEYKISGHLIEKGYDRFAQYIETEHNFKLLTPRSDYTGMSEPSVMKFQCQECGYEIEKKFHYGRGLNCDICNPRTPSFTSAEEQAVFDFITDELGVTGYQRDKTIIAPFELDMVFPKEKIAIEYSGLYWHSEVSSGKGRKYHQDKLLAANRQGYRLITIFSDEWNQRSDVVKSKLRNIFGKTARKYHARKTQVLEMSNSEAKRFLDQYHLQGFGSSKINLGLTDPVSGEILAVMTFSQGRAALNTQVETGEYELVRFATNGSAVIGGASKLLKYFFRNFQPRKITSYADLRWSEGNVYSKLGFQKLSEPTIGYWYVDGYQQRMHRFNFTKRQLVKEGADPGKTEWEIMQELGYDRIWDCGHQKFVLEISSEN